MAIRIPLAVYGTIALASLALVPILDRPAFAVLIGIGIAAAFLGGYSPAIPVALMGFPPLLIALVGWNPFPTGSVPIFFFAWTAIAVAAHLAIGRESPSLVLVSVPVLLSVAIAAVMIVALSASAAPAYGVEKSQLFLATNLTLLIAGIVVAARREHLLLLLVLTLAVATAGALLLTWGFVTRTLVPTIGDGRYSLAAEQYPIELARQTGHAILIALFLVLAGSTKRLRLAGLAALPLLSVAMIAAGSRGPILGLLAGAVVLLALASGVRTTRGRLLGAACATVVAGVVVAQIVPESTIQRSLSTVLASSSGLDSNGRSEIWSKAAEVVREHPVTGIGTGGYAAVDPELVYPHNLPLEVAVELGVVGLLLLIALLAHALVVLRGVWRRGGDALRGEVALIAGLYASAFVNALLSHDIQGNAAVWLAIGLGTGLSLRLRHAQTSAGATGRERAGGPRFPRAARA